MKSPHSSTVVHTLCPYENALKKVCCFAFWFWTKTFNQPSLLGPRQQRAAECKCECVHVYRNVQCSVTLTGTNRGVQSMCTNWLTAHSSMSQKDNKKTLTFLFHNTLPVLEGRNQSALKIDMRGERSRAAAEGEHAGRGGRWQLVAWISASQTGPMAILHTLCPVQPC